MLLELSSLTWEWPASCVTCTNEKNISGLATLFSEAWKSTHRTLELSSLFLVESNAYCTCTISTCYISLTRENDMRQTKYFVSLETRRYIINSYVNL